MEKKIRNFIIESIGVVAYISILGTIRLCNNLAIKTEAEMEYGIPKIIQPECKEHYLPRSQLLEIIGSKGEITLNYNCDKIYLKYNRKGN